MSFGPRYLNLFYLLLAVSLISAHHRPSYYGTRGLMDHQKKVMSNYRVIKKNGFISRGWGASGMPLSTAATSSVMEYNGVETPIVTSGGAGGHVTSQKSKFLRQLLNSNYHRPGARDNYSIPQLFVSYGWGPMGWIIIGGEEEFPRVSMCHIKCYPE